MEEKDMEEITAEDMLKVVQELRTNSDLSDNKIANLLQMDPVTFARCVHGENTKKFRDAIEVHTIFEMYGSSMESYFKSGKKTEAYIQSLKEEISRLKAEVEAKEKVIQDMVQERSELENQLKVLAARNGMVTDLFEFVKTLGANWKSNEDENKHE
jgi:predicted RNase H-like nuclease (RuvC/YqgF family)